MNRSTTRLSFLAVGLISFCGWSQPGKAAQVVFFDRDDSSTFMTSLPNSLAKFTQFTGALTAFGINDIDSVAAGPNPTLTFGATGITATTQGVVATSAPGFQIGSQALLELDAAGSPQVNTVLTFNQSINAFGLYVIQGGDGANNNNPTTFRLSDTANPGIFSDVPAIQVGPGWGQDNVYFFGVIDTVPFNQVEIREAGDFADGQLYDNIVAGVPEPGSLVLMALGGMVLAGRVIRSRRRQVRPIAVN
jgi:hypothetical protein